MAQGKLTSRSNRILPSALRRPIGAVLLVSLVACSAPDLAVAGDDPISAAVASLYVGRTQVVEGKVEAAERRDSTVRLHLGTTPQSLVVSLILGLLSRFPAHPEQYYLGKEVRVVGTIESFRGVPEISVHDPDHIQVVESTSASSRPLPPTEPAQLSADEAAKLRQQVEQMRTRMQDLETRLKQLEPNPPPP